MRQFAKTLSRHEKTHTKESFTCGQCDGKFNTKRGLQEYDSRVHSSVLHPCDQCKKSFTCKSSLKKYVKSHNNVEKTFECEYCSKYFSSPSKLKRHVMTCRIVKVPGEKIKELTVV